MAGVEEGGVDAGRDLRLGVVVDRFESTERRPRVAGVAWIAPPKPERTRTGSEPAWSMWAWVRIAASAVQAARGRWALRRRGQRWHGPRYLDPM